MAKSKLDIAGRLSKVVPHVRKKHWLDKFRLAHPEECAELLELVDKHQANDVAIRRKLSNDRRLAEFVSGILAEYGLAIKAETVQKWIIDRRFNG